MSANQPTTVNTHDVPKVVQADPKAQHKPVTFEATPNAPVVNNSVQVSANPQQQKEHDAAVTKSTKPANLTNTNGLTNARARFGHHNRLALGKSRYGNMQAKAGVTKPGISQPSNAPTPAATKPAPVAMASTATSSLGPEYAQKLAARGPNGRMGMGIALLKTIAIDVAAGPVIGAVFAAKDAIRVAENMGHKPATPEAKLASKVTPEMIARQKQQLAMMKRQRQFAMHA